MPLSVSISVIGEEQMARTLVRSGQYASDLTPVWSVIEEDIRQIGSAQFASQGARSSGGWAPLDPDTIARKRSHGAQYPERILWLTGDLRDAVSSPSHPDQLVTKTQDELHFRLIGDSELKGAVAQSGSSSKNIPRRRVLEFTAFDRERFARDIQRYVIGGNVDWINRVL